MSDMDATPRPWAWSAKTLPPHDVDVYEASTTAGVARILGGNDQDYGDELVQKLAEANADLIVRAVNERDADKARIAALEEALRRYVTEYEMAEKDDQNASAGVCWYCQEGAWGHDDDCPYEQARILIGLPSSHAWRQNTASKALPEGQE